MRRPAIPAQSRTVLQAERTRCACKKGMTGVKKDSEALVGWTAMGKTMVGLDLADRTASWCAMDEAGELRRGKLRLTGEALTELLSAGPRSRVVMEAGTQTRWVAQAVERSGHEAVVVAANVLARPKGRRKNDERDARLLMEVGWDLERKRVPIVWQRPDEWQQDLATVRMRDAVVRARSSLNSAVRGSVKPFGERIGDHPTESMPGHARRELPAWLNERAAPLLEGIEDLGRQVAAYDQQLAAMLTRRPESERLLQVHGVGPVTASVFMAVIGDPRRFQRSRDVAAYLGLAPGQDQSGEEDPQLAISKTGDRLARRVLVQCAHYILGHFGQDSALRRWGLKLAGDGKNRARKKKAVVAVARKLATLLHRLWVSGERYEPLRGHRPGQREEAA